MANLTITPENVGLVDQTGTRKLVQFAQSVACGDVVFLNASSGKYQKATAGATSIAAEATGIVLTPGDADDYGYICTAGLMDVGATLTVGGVYVLSATSAKICPPGDLVTDDFLTILGYAKLADQLFLKVTPTGVQIP